MLFFVFILQRTGEHYLTKKIDRELFTSRKHEFYPLKVDQKRGKNAYYWILSIFIRQISHSQSVCLLNKNQYVFLYLILF